MPGSFSSWPEQRIAVGIGATPAGTGNANLILGGQSSVSRTKCPAVATRAKRWVERCVLLEVHANSIGNYASMTTFNY